MKLIFFRKWAYRRLVLSVIFCGLFISFSLQAATIPVTKANGTPLVVPAYSTGDILEITGDSLEAGDWSVLNALTDDYHLVNTLNKQVPDQAFLFCSSLLSASFPEVISIEKEAFIFCDNLTTVSFPKATSIKEYAFYETGLTTASFPKVTTIASAYAFGYCYYLTSASFPEATLIGGGAFYACEALASVDFPVATFIGDGSFGGCEALTSVSFPEAITVLGGAFGFCEDLTFVSLPKATSIGYAAFGNCISLTSISFPQLTSVGNSAFEHCTNLASVSIPKASLIGNKAFENCTGLTGIALDNTPPSLPTSGVMYPFNSVSALLLVVPDSTAYTSVLSGYPAGTESFNKTVSMEYGTLVANVGSTLTPNRIPTLSGGYYRWEKDGAPITGASGTTYQATSEGIYTLYYVRDELSVMLMSIHLAAVPYNLYGTYNRYQECENILRLSFIPSASDRTVEVWSEGADSAYVFDMNTGKYFKNKLTYDLSAGDSVITIHYGIDEDVEDAGLVTFAYQVSGGTVEQTDTFILYAKPDITLVKYYPTTAQFKGILEISITNGSYYIQRSLDNGRSWQFARDTLTGKTLPFSQSQIANFLPGDSILFRQPNGCQYETLVVGHKEGAYPEILRSVFIPPVTDAITSLQPGVYTLWSTDNFTFTITPTGSNVGKDLNVSTSRIGIPDSEGVLVVKNQDGSFTVTILYIQEAVVVSIDFVTGIESITGDAVWNHAGRIYIRSEKTGEASVYAISGSLVGRLPTGLGETASISLKKGLYVVILNGKTYKIMIN